jgi:hypothetical protein
MTKNKSAAIPTKIGAGMQKGIDYAAGAVMKQGRYCAANSRHVRSAYQPPASRTFLSEQTSHQQPASSTFLSEQISTAISHQPNEQAVGLQAHGPA